ncbi:MAG: hypothetical protein MZW92_09670 [Comamonadaceae bacterium]|nr:hypothetical protein [Comamonadaceae bacterium]
MVEAYQTRGYPASGRPPPFWRPFRLKKINAVSLLKEGFETRASEGFARDKERYRNGLVAMVDDRRRGATLPPEAIAWQTAAHRAGSYTVPQPEDSGPHPPKNPYRRPRRRSVRVAVVEAIHQLVQFTSVARRHHRLGVRSRASPASLSMTIFFTCSKPGRDAC